MRRNAPHALSFRNVLTGYRRSACQTARELKQHAQANHASGDKRHPKPLLRRDGDLTGRCVIAIAMALSSAGEAQSRSGQRMARGRCNDFVAGLEEEAQGSNSKMHEHRHYTVRGCLVHHLIPKSYG